MTSNELQTSDIERKVLLCNLTELPVQNNETPQLCAVWDSSGDGRRIVAWLLQTGAGMRYFMPHAGSVPLERLRHCDYVVPGVELPSVDTVLDFCIKRCTK